MEWSSFRTAMILSDVESCGRKWPQMASGSEKRALWWNQDVKEAIRAKKNAFEALLQNRSSSDLQSRYTEARKAAVLAVKMSEKRFWEEFVRPLDSNYSTANNNVFWQMIR